MGKNYFRTENAATEVSQIDSYVVRRLRGLLVKKRDRNLHAGVADQWTEDWFNDHGLYRVARERALPEGCVTHVKKITGKPCAGNRTHGLKGDGNTDPHCGHCAPDYQ